jgi:hypothetical protein
VEGRAGQAVADDRPSQLAHRRQPSAKMSNA